MKALSSWVGSILNGLSFVAGLAMAAWIIIKSDDPLATALSLFLPAMAVVALGIGLFGGLHFLKARLSGRAFRALTISVVAVLLLLWIVGGRIIERYGDDGAGIAGGWNALQAFLNSGHAVRDLIAFSAEPLIASLATGVIGGLIYAMEKTLRGDALWIARITAGAVATFIVVVVYPARLEFQGGWPPLNRALLLSLLLWLGIVVPAVGVAIAYRRIGDGRS